MSQPINYILSSLVTLHNETAMLEICDWDEDKLGVLYSNLEKALLDVSTPITENLRRFCSQQFYIDKGNRDSLYDLLEQAMITEMKELVKTESELEN